MGERIKCKKCGDILQSKYRHDFQMCKCGSCYIDGGDDYCRVGGKKEDIEWLDRKEKNKINERDICTNASNFDIKIENNEDIKTGRRGRRPLQVPESNLGITLIALIITIIVLAVSGVDYDVYNQGARYLSWFLTPATVCLAIPLYEQWSLLKKNYKAVVVGIASGVLTSLTTVLVLSKLMNLSHAEYVTLLPKSITTAIGMGVSEELGGYVTITVAVIVVTGVLGNIFGELICKIFRIKEPIAKGLALGSAAHAIGTAKAMEMGEIEGAMSSLSIAVAGILTVALSSLFAGFM